MSGPENWKCPISLEIFEDPVICEDGITYERSSIEQYFQRPESFCFDNDQLRISPMTRQQISMKMIPNYALKNTIEEYYAKTKLQEQTRLSEEQSYLNVECVGVSEENSEQSLVYLSINPPENGPKRDNVYIAVIDVSGSMDGAALDQNVEGHTNKTYSRLDLVKYSLETMISNCDDNDYFGFVTFSTNAKTVLGLTRMDKNGREVAKRVIYEQKADSMTNLWAGIEAGLELAKNQICYDKNVNLVVLTDGNSNQDPPRGVYATTEQYLKKNPQLICSINTMGFGYDLNCNLLYDISLKLGNGCFMFLPDCTMIGTNMTSFIAKTRCCYARNITVQIEGNNCELINEIINGFNLGTHTYLEENGTLDSPINFGTLEYGQNREFYLRVKHNSNNPIIKLKLSYDLCGKLGVIDKEIQISTNISEQIDNIFDRSHFLKLLHDLKAYKQKANKDQIETCIQQAKDYFKNKNNTQYLRELDTYLKEDEGQVAKAFSNDDWFNKWGNFHYLYLLSSHIRRFNSNFKDPSVQQYGGNVFEKSREEAEEIFKSLRAPEPTCFIDSGYSSKFACGNQSVNIVQACLNRSAGCFSGDSIVILSNGKEIQVSEVQPGDEIMSWNEKSSKVLCIVKIKCHYPIEMVSINGMKITPYHPVFINNKWTFPIDLYSTESYICDYVYDFVLDSENVCLINGISCVTWGHDFKDDVVSHPYFGSKRIISDLMKLKGWFDGYVIINNVKESRDPITGLINGIEDIRQENNDNYRWNKEVHVDYVKT